MRLIDDWRWVWSKAWSVKFIIAAAVLSGAEVALSVLTAYSVPVPISPGAFAALSGLISCAALIARFVAQCRD